MWPRRWIVAFALVLAASGAEGATETGTLTVTATVQTECALNGGTLDFGTYASGQVQDLRVTGRIDYVNCSGLLSFELDGGQAGSVAGRYMVSGDDRLRYQLYQTPARITLWGQGEDDLRLQLFTTQSGSVEVYGTIPGGQAVPPGTYADVVNITLTF
ncbi:MAG: spore coat protein U domain-containing protein [Geminicoccaceae bacterium]|nr:spore coat protein U domain-containing protein [Geminicoccaceae bacterium]